MNTIIDSAGLPLDESTALARIVAALDHRFPDHNTPADRLGRLLEELGELAEVVASVEHDTTIGPGHTEFMRLTKELEDVLRAASGVARHYDVPVQLGEAAGPLVPPVKPLLVLAEIAAAAGQLAKCVHHAVGMGIKKDKYGEADPNGMATAITDTIDRTLVLTAHYQLRKALRSSIETHYRRYQHEGWITDGVMSTDA